MISTPTANSTTTAYDRDANIYSGASELCSDGIDKNCNGEIGEVGGVARWRVTVPATDNPETELAGASLLSVATVLAPDEKTEDGKSYPELPDALENLPVIKAKLATILVGKKADAKVSFIAYLAIGLRPNWPGA